MNSNHPNRTGAKMELYNLKDDPGKGTTSLMLIPKIVEAIRRQMKEAHTPSPLWTLATPQAR